MADGPTRRGDRVRTVEIVATLSLATDLSLGVPLEHGLHSALIARRLSDLMEVDHRQAADAFYAALLFGVGCTGTALTASRIFGNDVALTRYATPVRFDRPGRQLRGMARAVAPPGRALHRRAAQLAVGMPRLVRALPEVVATDCDVAQLLFARLGVPAGVATLFLHANDRWDGKGWPARARGDAIPLPMRIAQVARDAAFQRMLGGEEFAARVIRGRAGAAFDPAVAELFCRRSDDILPSDLQTSVWSQTLAGEPGDDLVLEGDAIDDALGAMATSPTLSHRSCWATPLVSRHSPPPREQPAGSTRTNFAPCAGQRSSTTSVASRYPLVSGRWRGRSHPVTGRP